MIARAALPFTLRHILDRAGLASIGQRNGPAGGIRPNRLQGLFAALGDWSQLPAHSWLRLFFLRL